VTTFAYDANNNLLTITDAEGGVTTYAYDARNLLVDEVFPQGDRGKTQRRYTYDGARRLGQRVVSLADSTFGRMETTDYSYDMVNRLVERAYAEERVSDLFTYDAASRLLTATSQRYATIVGRSYDDGSRLVEELLSIDGRDYRIAHDYDAANRMVGHVYPNGDQVTQSWTDRNQLQAVRYNGQVVSDHWYDAGRRESSRTLGNGLRTDFSYGRGDNQLTRITTSGGVQELAYRYDANKRKTIVADLVDLDQTQQFAYDAEDRLTGWHQGPEMDPFATQTWDLSLVGDWNATQRTGGTDPIDQTRSHTAVHEVTAINGNPLGYDFKGNLQYDLSNGYQDLGFLAGVWDAENRLRLALVRTDGGGFFGGYAIAVYRYDALGRRVQKQAGRQPTTTYISAGPQVVQEYETRGRGRFATRRSTPARSYAYGMYVDEPLVVVDGRTDERFWYHRDHRYSVEKLTDQSGNVVVDYDYDAYGKQTVVSGASPAGQTYGHTGRRHDAETGLQYFRARYYSAELGRFIARDPLGYVDGWQLYAAYFAPYRMDPYGRSWTTGDFIGHYWFGGGDAVDLQDVGVFDEWRNVNGVNGPIEKAKQAVLDEMLGKGSCPSNVKRESGGPKNIRTNSTTKGNAHVMGNSIVKMTYTCTIISDCEECECDSGEELVSVGVGCTFNFELRDRFANPLDWGPGIAYEFDPEAFQRCMDNCKSSCPPRRWARNRCGCHQKCSAQHPQSELPLATPYDITASWTESGSDAKDFPGCSE
jgi:RHS repeat-associated protein